MARRAGVKSARSIALTLPAGKLHDALGIREVSYIKGQSELALKEEKLG